MNRERLGQIRLPAPEDFDPHPRLLLNGRGIHAGETFHALFPDGWREITIEMTGNRRGPAAGTSPPPVLPTSVPSVCS